MSNGWTLDQRSERERLDPWLAGERDPDVRSRVLEFVAAVVRDPLRPNLEDKDERTGESLGLFSVQVPRTRTAIVWTLDWDKKTVVLVHIGSV